MNKRIDFEEVRNFISKQGPDTKIYLGADSERIIIDDKWYADYTVAIVVHINACNGCKVFGETKSSKEYEKGFWIHILHWKF